MKRKASNGIDKPEPKRYKVSGNSYITEALTGISNVILAVSNTVEELKSQMDQLKMDMEMTRDLYIQAEDKTEEILQNKIRVDLEHFALIAYREDKKIGTLYYIVNENDLSDEDHDALIFATRLCKMKQKDRNDTLEDIKNKELFERAINIMSYESVKQNAFTHGHLEQYITTFYTFYKIQK
jgi:hypothetical protein